MSKKVGTRKRGSGLSSEFREKFRKEVQQAKAEGKDFCIFFQEKVLELASKKSLSNEVIEEFIKEAQSTLTEAEAEERYLKELLEIEKWAKQERTEEEWQKLAEEAEQELKKIRGYGE